MKAEARRNGMKFNDYTYTRPNYEEYKEKARLLIEQLKKPQQVEKRLMQLIK